MIASTIDEKRNNLEKFVEEVSNTEKRKQMAIPKKIEFFREDFCDNSQYYFSMR